MREPSVFRKRIEVSQEKVIGVVTSAIIEAPKVANRNFLVALSGVNCAGKSTLAQSLRGQHLGLSEPACTFDIDDFLHERRIRNGGENQIQACYDSFDYAVLFGGILERARRETKLDTTVRALNRELDRYEERRIKVLGPCVVIMEGIFLLRADLPGVFDFKIWLEIREEEILRRALCRERELAHHPTADSIRNRYNQRFIPALRYHISRDRPSESCDLHVVIT